MKPYILIIVGPTASGKTKIGVECAKKFNGEIVSADSMQIYKGMNINTAKVSTEEMQGIPHYMIDVVDADKQYSVSEYVCQAREHITDIINRGKLPIIVGGTGLYIKSLIYNYSFANSKKDESIRNKYQKLLDNKGKDYLYDILKKVDPDSAKNIHPNNVKRVIRALEIYESTGIKKSNNQNDLNKIYDYTMIVLDIPRQQLYDRINLRVDKMIENGGAKEAEYFIKNLNKNCQSMQAIGYKEFVPYVDNSSSLEQVSNELKKATRHYAKRQITYFKSFEDALWFNPLTQKDLIFNTIQEKLNENKR